MGYYFYKKLTLTVKKKQKGKGRAKDQIHFSHGKTNFYIRRRGWEGFIDSKLDAQDGNSILSLVKLIRFKETQDLCDKWGEKIRNLID